MPTIYLYHGTTYENYQEMVSGNEFPMRQNWKCSRPNEIYFYGATCTKEIQTAIDSAKDSAILAAGIQDSKSDRVVVIGTWLTIPNDSVVLDKGKLKETFIKLKELGEESLDEDEKFMCAVAIDSTLSIEIKPDLTDDFAFFDYCRFSIDLQDFLKRVRIHDCIILKQYRYFPKDRWKYMYNLYHSCAGMSYDLCKDFVVNREEMEKQCDKWYEEHHEYEWWFREDLDKCTLIL